MEQEQKKMMSFALPLELKQNFSRICAENDTTASQKIRHLMSWYIQKKTKEEKREV